MHNQSPQCELISKGGSENRKSSLTHTAPLVLAQLPAFSTATTDLALCPHGTYVVATTISQLAGCDICSGKKKKITCEHLIFTDYNNVLGRAEKIDLFIDRIIHFSNKNAQHFCIL